jgi:hypothetical protein
MTTTTLRLQLNFFDDYEGRGKAAKEQEMEIDGHMSWGHDFKLISRSEWRQHRFCQRFKKNDARAAGAMDGCL